MTHKRLLWHKTLLMNNIKYLRTIVSQRIQLLHNNSSTNRRYNINYSSTINFVSKYMA
jgi:hypothetical protein